MDAAVGIVAQRDNERAHDLAETLVETVERVYGDPPVVDEATGEEIDARAVPVTAMASCELVVSIGGDGTLLFVAREVGATPILGINLGEVGFLNAVDPTDATAVVTDLVSTLQSGSPLECRELARLQATGVEDDWALEPALNEVLVHGPRRGHGGGARFDVAVDGDQYAESHADGVLVATPTGSTAYNLSEGGPLVHPNADVLVVAGMAAVEPMTPLVADPSAAVTISVSDADTAYTISDGRNRQRLEPPATVSITRAEKPVRLVGPRSNFFESLEKLE